MPTLKLTPHVTGQRSTDLDVSTRRAQIVSGPEETAQRIRVALQTQRGETPYQRSKGTPYREVIKASNATPFSVRAAIAAVVRSVAGVRDVLECNAYREGDVMRVQGIALDVSGAQIPFGTEVAS
jgi:hypothetical protein